MDKSQRFLKSSQQGLAPMAEAGYGSRQVQPYDQPLPEFGEEVSSQGLLDYLRLGRRHKGALLLSVLVGTVLGLFYSMSQTPVYRAYASLEIHGFDQSLMPGNAGGGGESTQTDIFTAIEVMRSAPLIERVVAKLGLDDLVPPQKPWDPSLMERLMGTPPPLPRTPLQRMTGWAQASLDVNPAGQARVLSISYDSPDPRGAAEFANALAEEFINYSLEMRWESAQRTHDWLTKQLVDFKEKLADSERKMQAYARDSALLITSGTTSVSEDKLRQLQAGLVTAQGERVVRQSQYELAVATPIDALPDVIDSDVIRTHQMRLAELRSESAQLRSTLTPRHYKVQQVEAQITELASTLEQERTRIADRVRNEYQSALRREKILQNDFERQAGLVTQEAQKSIEYNMLKHDVESNRQLYDGMLQRMKEASVLSALQATSARVLDPATPPTRPYAPNPVQGGVVGMFAGMLLGFGFVLLREWTDRSIKGPGDTTFYLNLPALGTIPSARRVPGGMSRLDWLPLAPSIRKLLSLQTAGKNGANGTNGTHGLNGRDGKHGALTVHGSEPCIELATWQQKNSLLAECYRATLTSILFSSQQGDPPKIIVLSSPDPGEGKTSTVSNLGIALAEIGRRVVLVDGDMRRPRLHRVFGLPGNKGLTDLLRSEIPIDQHSIDKIAHPTEVPGLFVLPGGSGAVNISNLLYSARMPELLERLKAEFDTVLIDSPPMLQIPDARVLGRMADAVILVVRAGQTSRDSAVAASQRFAEDHTPVLGTILNQWDPRGHAGFYDGYHEYYKSTQR